MSLPYLPLYIDDFEAATAHLTMLEDGAYNRLLRLCWRSPGCKLPNDEAWIIRKMRATSEAEKAAVFAVLAEFFTRGRGKVWSKRLLSEHLQISVSRQRRKEAGKSGGLAKAQKNKDKEPSNAVALLKQPEPEPYSSVEANASPGADAPPDPDRLMFDSGRALLVSAGKSPDQAGRILGKWRKDHGAEAVIAAIGRARREGAVDPVAFISGCLLAKPQSRASPAIGERKTAPDGRELEWSGIDGWMEVRG